ncbi:MAG: Crp/Fnr family transcriptional regulator [Prolixibacteraceae bacterium]|nr:Crp/Fnr family transcriptional regulator [Prolixibacteraceae bacterium]
MRENLLQIPLFAGLGAEELNGLFERIVFQTRSFGPNALVVSQGEECNSLMILTEGVVKGEMSGADGRNLKIEDLQSPTVLAPAFIFGKKNRYPVNIISYNEAHFIVIPKNELFTLFQHNASVLQNFLGMISSRAQFLSEKLQFHSFKSLKAKLAFYLFEEADGRSEFKLKHSQNELAELFGVARPSVGRTLMQLQEEQIVDVRYKKVKILDMLKLTRACNHLNL